MLRAFEKEYDITLQENLLTSIEDFLIGYKERYGY